ncbi:uncharacterized protein LOC125677540 [Ostrea edulis]|uniref:uncharacterized protein LOC125677540 n=1 Tax=Ostrea edulis TaxID=37623 RepID=UPI002095ACF6|nr:uncharacterized protein LOC125677540 [Ostrea edulis]
MSRISQYSEIENSVVHDSNDENTEVEDEFVCNCSSNCLDNFLKSEITDHIYRLREMTKEEKEMYIMGSIKKVGNKKVTSKRKERKRARYEYSFESQAICRKAFLIVYDTTEKVFKNIAKHLDDHGAVPREHGNKGKKPVHALQFEEIQRAILFITNYAAEVGMPQPEAPRGSDGIPPIYLPSSDTKKAIHQRYNTSCQETGVRALRISSFEDAWLKCVPHIKISKPRDDVCQRCECLRKQIIDAVTEEEKLAAVENFQKHIADAKKERLHYRSCIETATNEMARWEGGELNNVHYTFDFAQHFQLPHHSRQMGPTYFAQLRRVQVFGVRVDSVSKQLNYIIDEDQTIGADGTLTNGPNAVISMLDHALSEHGFGEMTCSLHADNCSGQNKNQYVLGYLCWRVMTGRHSDINYSMQIPGHTRCLVDSGFAHIRKLFRRSDVDSLGQFQTLVNKSSVSNEAVPYGDAWNWRDWKTFLSTYYRAVKGIRKYHHFRFTSEEPWNVYVKERVDSDEKMVFLKKNGSPSFDAAALPEILLPVGLTRERQQYLYRNVRPYVRPAHQDSLCPTPSEE